MKRFIQLILLASLLTGCLERQTNRHIDNSSIKASNNKIIKIAQKHLGKPYKYGAVGPNRFDCSGFVYAVFKSAGINIPRTSIAQSRIRGKKLSRNQIREGDILLFDTSLKGHVNHSGIYLGDGKFIHASSGRAYSVTISSLNGWYKDKFRWGKRIPIENH
jgi:cell wall-associated NlpC family hydrolase